MSNYLSIDLITDSLGAQGFSYHDLTRAGKLRREFMRGSLVWETPCNYPLYPFVSRALRHISVQKNLAYEHVAAQGFAVPQTTRLVHNAPIDETSLPSNYPLIVKPVDGSGSANIVRNVTVPGTLLSAVRSLHEQGLDVLIQRQFSGQELRFTVLDNEVLSVCLRAAPSLTGNGVQTVRELLIRENEARTMLKLPYITYPQLDESLVTLPSDMEAIPKEGEIVQLGTSTMISGGASVYAIDREVDASYKRIVLDLARSLEASFLVVDLLVADYTQPASEDNYVFLEFNTSPALKLYYSFRSGAACDIVPLLTKKIIATLTESVKIRKSVGIKAATLLKN